MDKNDKKKALDLMIVLGGPKGGKGKDEEEDYDSKDHSGCKCPCCGAPCEDCADEEHESDEDYED